MQTNSPWNVLPTIGFSLVIFTAFITVQTLAAATFAYIQIRNTPNSSLLSELIALSTTGLGIAVSLIPGALVGSGLIILFAYLRKNITVHHYLKLNFPTLKSFLLWLGLLILFTMGLEALNAYLQRPTPSWMIDAYITAGYLPLFWFAVIIAAPVFEELFFRGFLLEGLRHSPVGNLGAVVITSAIWASIHLQYELFEITSIFLIGLLLGYARIKSNSLYTPIILHALMNLAATVQVAALINK